MESRGVRLAHGDRSVDVRPGKGAAALDGRPVAFCPVLRDGALEAIEMEGSRIPVRVAREGDRAFVWCGGKVFEIRRSARAAHASEHAGDLVSPMPGRVRRALVSAGDAVTRGQVVMILEAMKMEHAILAPKDGVVRRVVHGEGDLVDAGVALAEIT